MTTATQRLRFHDYLNRLQQISSTPSASGAATISSTYGYNVANQRTASTNADASFWLYGYDALGQVTSGKKYWNSGTAVAGQHFEYAFDDIGNRTSTKTGGDGSGSNLRTATYTANLINQYTNRTVPGYLEVNGTASTNATVTVNGLSPLRQGDYYRQELTVANGSSAVSLWITNKGIDLTSTSIVARATTVPKTPEAYQYDADGNLVQDGLRKYTWDGENRLIRIETLTNSWSAENWQRVDCAYDPQGRRLEKEIRKWDPTSGSYQVVSRRKYFYWGWNLMGEVDEVSGLRLSYTWGLDLSGTMQGAGGVGGLLKVKVHSGPFAGDYFYTYDGNGNVMALVSAVDGTVAARYETGPFGELVRASGPMAKVNPFRFSTKYQDDETDLSYYGYRSYNPTTGRWLSRDPIAESGGLNLYGFVKNNPKEYYDLFGLLDRVNCHKFSIKVEGKEYKGVGVTIWVQFSGEVCDCACGKKVVKKGDYVEAIGDFGIKLGVGVADEVTILGAKVGYSFLGPQLESSFGSVFKGDCGEEPVVEVRNHWSLHGGGEISFGEGFGISGSFESDLYAEAGLKMTKHSGKGFVRFGHDTIGEITISVGIFNYARVFHIHEDDATFVTPTATW